MSKQIEKQIKKRIDTMLKEDPSGIELDLSEINIGRFTPQICSLFDKCKNLQVLHLVECELTTLEGFPNLTKLAAIDLSRNNIDDNSHIQVLLKYPELSQVIMTENKIQKLETVLKLEPLQKLIQIDLEKNKVANEADYRKTIFQKFPNMEYLDRKDANGEEQPAEEEVELDDGQGDEDEDQYDQDDDQEQFDQDEDDYEQQQSEEKPKKGTAGRKKK